MNKTAPNAGERTRTGPLLEVIACSVDDAVAAAEGGADRLEIISHFEVGGLTPAPAIVREIIAAVRIPVRVMLRESEGFEIDDENEKRRLCALAGELAELPIEGIVCGFLRDGGIDHPLLERVLSNAPHLRVTFHRAFEEVTDPLQALQELKRHTQVDRILTSGGAGTDEQKVEILRQCDLAAAPEITILAGGGMTESMAVRLRQQTGISEFHVGTVVRVPATCAGAVDARRVSAFISSCLR